MLLFGTRQNGGAVFSFFLESRIRKSSGGEAAAGSGCAEEAKTGESVACVEKFSFTTNRPSVKI